MTWMQERDALIAQTRAFVEQVRGRTSEVDRRLAGPDGDAPHPQNAERAPLAVLPTKPADTALPADRSLLPDRFDQVSMSAEIRARIAAFRAHQERFNRERHDYFNTTLARLRASLDELPPPARAPLAAIGGTRPPNGAPSPGSRRPAAGVPAATRRPTERTPDDRSS